jgi:hypothetical protein
MGRRRLAPSNLFHRQADPLPPLFEEPNPGDFYYNSFSRRLRVFFDGQWRDATAGSNDEVFVGPNDPGLNAGYELWWDTDATSKEAITTVLQSSSPPYESPWMDAELTEGWEYYDHRTVRFRKTNSGLVVIEGVVRDGAARVSVIFTLPVGYRPKWDQEFVQPCDGGIAIVKVRQDGDVLLSEAVGLSIPRVCCHLNLTFWAD